MERRIMSPWKAIFTTTLLVSMSAAGQQVPDSQASAEPNRTSAVQNVQPSQQAADPTPPATAQAAPVQQPATAPAPSPAPITMDDVVNVFLEREHALIKLLSN